VSEDIKKQSGEWRAHLAAYRESLANLAAAGIEVVCYNFMPVLDWTRTDIAYRLPHGGTCLRFDLADFAAFDLYILERPGAADDYPADLRDEAARRAESMGEDRRHRLARTVAAGLPGTDSHLTLDGLRAHLADYGALPAETLRAHFTAFLEAVVPTAESLGLRLCCHPDDPPFALLGLPRIMSTEADYAAIMAAVDSPANGVTLCSGSLGARPDNDLPGMMRRLGPRVHFLHLRNVKRESAEVPGSFPRGRTPGWRHRHGGADRRSRRRGAAPPRRRPRRRLDPVPPRSRPRAARRPETPRPPRLSRHRPPARAGRAARRHRRADASGARPAGLTARRRLAVPQASR
jgi:mannonate dehydratase